MSQLPSEDSSQLDDLTKGLEPLEPLIDASLDEYLGDAHPRIGKALEKILSQSNPTLFSQDVHDLAVQRAKEEVQAIARSRLDRSEPARGSRGYRFDRSNPVALTMIAASLGALALLAFWSLNRSEQGEFLHSNIQHDLKTDDEASGQTIDRQMPQDAVVATTTEVDPRALPDDQHFPERVANSIAIEPIPPNKVHDSAPTVSENPQSMLDVTPQVARVDNGSSSDGPGTIDLGHSIDRQIISVIDSQFQLVWKQAGMLDEPTLKRTLPTERIALLLLDRFPTSSELESIRRGKLSTDQVVQEWIAADEFNRVWAGKLARFYTGGRSIPMETQLAFLEWLKQQIQGDVPIREIQRQVLLGLRNPQHPAYFLRDVWSQKASGIAADSARWVGLSETQSTKLTGLSQLFLSVTGNSSIVCTQCHLGDATSTPSWLAESIATAPPVVFDSIAAMMLPSFDSARVELFTKQEDDRVSKIAVRFPDGKRVGNEVAFEEVISAWVEQGSHSQSSMVNALWKEFFGDALHLGLGLDSAVAPQEKSDLVGYLSKQVVEQQAGVRQFVYWILMSEPARQNEEEVSRTEYLAMDSQKLSDYLMRRGSLKSLVIREGATSRLGSKSLEGFVLQLFPEQPDWLERSLLAQPSSLQGSPNKSGGTSNAVASMDLPSASDRDLLQAELRYRAASDQVRRWGRLLSESELPEDQMIQHVYLISKHRFPTDQELGAWMRSAWSKSERFSSVLRMLTGVDSYEP